MRNLKRVLSLTLASVMLLGMMVIGSSAAGVTKIDFADANDIEYTEAVDVMVALEILEGSGKNFNPKEILTREQAAKIICYMLLGSENAEKLTANSDVFKDVAANRWSAGYISYCAERKILSGVGGGNFAPDGQLTGVAFGKMLLVALGYDPAVQGYTGSSWALSVGADMVDAGIAPAGVLLNSPMTREQAAQTAFQTLTADVVRYTQKPVTVTNADGSTVIVGAGEVVSVTSGVGVSSGNYAGDGADKDGYGTQQFCEKYFPRLQMTTAPDDFGCPATQWKYKGAEIGKYANESDLVYTSDVKMETIYKDLGLSDTVDKDNVKFWIDGVVEVETASTGIQANDGKTYLNAVGINKGTDKDVKVGAKGSTTCVYYDPDATTDKVIVSVTNYYLAQATKDYSTKDENVTFKIWGSRADTGASINNLTVKNEDVAVSDVLKDDYLVVTMDLDGDTNPVIKTAVSVEAVANVTISSARSGDYVTADSKYEYNGLAKADTHALGQDKMDDSSLYSFNDDEYTLYLDPNGYVLGVELVTGEGNVGDYLVITGTPGTDREGVYVKVMFTDGTEKAITVSKVGEANATTSNVGSEGKFFTFKEKSNGKYELTAVPEYNADADPAVTAKAQKAANDASISNKAQPISGVSITGTNNTVFIADGKVFTGIKNAPTVDAGTHKLSYVTDKDGRLLIVWTNAKGKNAVSADELVYILDSKPAVHGSGSDAYYTYDVIYKGEKTTLDINDGPTKAPGLYEIDSYTDGHADLGKNITSTGGSYIAGTATAAYGHKDYILEIPGVGDEAFTLTDDAQVFTIDGTTVNTLNAENGVDESTFTDFKTVIMVKEKDETNYKISMVYLVKGNSGGPVTVPSTGNQGQAVQDALNGTSSKVEIKGTESGATIDKALNVPEGKELTLDGKVTVSGNITGNGTVTVAKDADITVSASKNLTVDSVAAGASIDATAGGKVTVADGGTIAAGAEIKVKALGDITIGDDVTVNEAVTLEGADSGTNLATVGAGIPVYIASDNSFKVGATENDISADTIFLTYEGRKVTDAETGVGKVTFVVKNASGTAVHTEEFSPANTNKGNFYFSLSHPTNGSGTAVENPFTNGSRYQVVISQVQGSGEKPTILASVWFTAKITDTET